MLCPFMPDERDMRKADEPPHTRTQEQGLSVQYAVQTSAMTVSTDFLCGHCGSCDALSQQEAELSPLCRL